MAGDIAFNNMAELAATVREHGRRIQALESAKAEVIMAVQAKVIEDMQKDLGEVKTVVNTLKARDDSRQGSGASWKAIFTYVFGGICAIATIITPYILLAVR